MAAASLGFFVSSQGRRPAPGSAQSAADGLPHDNRADTRHGLAEGLATGRSFSHAAATREAALVSRGIRPQAWAAAWQTGQQLADLAVLKIHTLEGIDDAAVLHQHQVE